MPPDGPPEGKIWIVIEGLYHDDLFEVEESNFTQECADARKQYKARYPGQCVIMKVGRVQSNPEGEQ